MIKLVYCWRRQPNMSREDAQRYWRETHGPLVRSHAEVLRIRRYVQVHTLDTPLNDVIGRSRGTAEDLRRRRGAMVRSRRGPRRVDGFTPEGRAAALELLEDERNFIDMPRSAIFVAEEHQFVGD